MFHYFYKSQIILTVALLTGCLTANAEVDVNAAKSIAKQNNCFRCHGVDKDKEGPAWNKISAKFKADPKAQEKLLHHLSSGEVAKFPDGHEEPHAILKSEDAKQTQNLVDWILSL